MVEDGWKFQLDNELPKILSTGDTFKIPAGVWHRVIKGAGNLKVKIKEHGKIGNN